MAGDDDDWKVQISELAREQMDNDPELAAVVRELNARLLQVLSGVGKDDHEAVAKALRSVGMEPVTDLEELARIDAFEDDDE